MGIFDLEEILLRQAYESRKQNQGFYGYNNYGQFGYISTPDHRTYDDWRRDHGLPTVAEKKEREARKKEQARQRKQEALRQSQKINKQIQQTNLELQRMREEKERQKQAEFEKRVAQAERANKIYEREKRQAHEARIDERNRQAIHDRIKEQVRGNMAIDYDYHELMTHYFLGYDKNGRAFDVDQYGVPYYLNEQDMKYYYYGPHELDEKVMVYSDAKRQRLGFMSLSEIPFERWVYGKLIDNNLRNRDAILADEQYIRERVAYLREQEARQEQARQEAAMRERQRLEREQEDLRGLEPEL